MNSIRSVAFPSPGEVRVSGGADSVIVTAYDGIFRASVSVKPADFLAAVAAECGVIVIPRADLPPVIEDRHGLHVDGLTVDGATTADDAMRDVFTHLAIVEYRKAHPPIDEAQVEALSAALAAATNEAAPSNWRAVAKRMYANGVRVEAVRP